MSTIGARFSMSSNFFLIFGETQTKQLFSRAHFSPPAQKKRDNCPPPFFQGGGDLDEKYLQMIPPQKKRLNGSEAYPGSRTPTPTLPSLKLQAALWLAQTHQKNRGGHFVSSEKDPSHVFLLLPPPQKKKPHGWLFFGGVFYVFFWGGTVVVRWAGQERRKTRAIWMKVLFPCRMYMDDLKHVPQNPVQGNKKWSGFRIGGEIPSSPECRRTKHNPEVFQPGNQYFPQAKKNQKQTRTYT